jgi:hypothetical protein
MPLAECQRARIRRDGENGLLSTMTVERVELNPGIGDDRFAMGRISPPREK